MEAPTVFTEIKGGGVLGLPRVFTVRVARGSVVTSPYFLLYSSDVILQMANLPNFTWREGWFQLFP